MPELYFDRDCSFCSRCVAFIQRGKRAKNVRFLPIQENQDRMQSGVDSLIWIEEGRTYIYSTAVIRAMVSCRGPLWKLLFLFPTPIRDAVYKWVARNRYRLFGSRACELPN
ncbi:MAG: DCC1-like thiol-disulfide oxidoreductase family protein [Bacteroidetes bacterium]|nr:DCC1-like thiol-disulfide oxidoreductase family protein [Bacteroidota bacterium]MDA0943278.1 DCC1-like thiol-disulfide oxidoreductase family protein [Bacteroidota bacterium]MDA1111133.1 DCC1-like thiol-disulfide oxidoreductase family protein [Bacteroidota bacterium]